MFGREEKPQDSEDSLKLLAWNFLTWSDLEYNGLKTSKPKLLFDKKALRKCDNLYWTWTLPKELFCVLGTQCINLKISK